MRKSKSAGLKIGLTVLAAAAGIGGTAYALVRRGACKAKVTVKALRDSAADIIGDVPRLPEGFLKRERRSDDYR